MTIARDELRALLDDPQEIEAVEFKSWMDLSDPLSKAKLARHIAALSNYGGGYIVFGFEPVALTPCAPAPHLAAKINSDIVVGIVDTYLSPTFHCEVTQVVSSAGSIHPVIHIPPHGTAPICAKRNGPDTKGVPQGIAAGSYYVRKPGPKSEAVRTAEEWAPIIRRCVMHERANLLDALSAALRIAPEPPQSDLLETWHHAAHSEFLRQVERVGDDLLKRSHLQLSYRVIATDGQQLSPGGLSRVLAEVNHEVHDLVATGWSMFSTYNEQLEWTADAGTGTDEDFVELSLIGISNIASASDFWRVSPSGLVTLIREYWEDGSFVEEKYGKKPGTILDPALMIRSLAELVRHAKAFAERFSSAREVEFRCQWRGLSGRRPFLTQRYGHILGHSTGRDERVATGRFPVGELGGDWPEVVARLADPLARSLGIEEFASATAIRELGTRFNSF